MVQDRHIRADFQLGFLEWQSMSDFSNGWTRILFRFSNQQVQMMPLGQEQAWVSPTRSGRRDGDQPEVVEMPSLFSKKYTQLEIQPSWVLRLNIMLDL